MVGKDLYGVACARKEYGLCLRKCAGAGFICTGAGFDNATAHGFMVLWFSLQIKNI